MTTTQDPPSRALVRHGTPAGYREHYLRHTPPCTACREAATRQERERRPENQPSSVLKESDGAWVNFGPVQRWVPQR